ncbi:MAG TPA: hypothetical protein DCQ97_06215 [Chitinophagaceae bacterium]|nr:hypothetical protein [Chitinophagaceae bacterium]
MIQMKKRSASLLLPLLLLASVNWAQPFRKKFEPGIKKRYQLVMEQWYNGKLNDHVVSVCELTTIQDSGAWYEEVKWISMVQYKEKDTLVLDSLAARVTAYRIALDSIGKMELPKIHIPEMTQPIQDFTTFFVAISPQLGINHLHRQGDVYDVPRIITGDLTSGNFILKGADCFHVQLKYASKKKKLATLITSFQAPRESCISYYLPEMSTQVVDGVNNNIQMVMPAKDKFNVQWGREEFTIESKVNTRTGRLLSATMDNSLTFKMKINCNDGYKECAFEMPFKIERKLRVNMME